MAALVALAAAGCEREQAPAQEKTHGASPVDGGDAPVPSLRRPEPRPAPADAGAAVRPPALPPAQGTGTAADGGASAVPAGGPGASAVSASAADAARTAADAGSAQAPTAQATTDAGADTWTAGVVKREHSRAAPGSVVLTAVRAARQEGFDRVVFEFSGDALPSYHLEYVDRPIIRCGSGEPTEVAGQGWLQVRLTGAQAHTDAGKPTVAPRERKLELGVLRELEHTCDFEGEVTWVLGVQKPNRFRVLELKAPTRLVVDVRN